MRIRSGVLTVFAGVQVACVGETDEPCADGANAADDGSCAAPEDGDDDDDLGTGSDNTTTDGNTTDTDTTDTDTTDTDTDATDTDTDSTDGTYAGPTLIDLVEIPGCDGTNTWYYNAETVGWTDGNNLVNAWETGVVQGWNEEHPLPSVAFGPGNTYDLLEQGLTAGVAAADFTPGVNTLFSCGTHDVDPIMTYAVRVYDIDGNYADCAMFATDPTGTSDVFVGIAPDRTPITRRGEINPGDCTIWFP